ncbi:hypothetical protein C8F04DRAFT_1240111 [Mycena alexandri]|uniref:Uncharacterized protein n=1 Tax=Mycena alexandri TaxID=1745969 RepID=A0AAD6S9J3_9AGAR|nr:hypothetical protein C8F04DRAFT_1240111 [Mycena alexandri]
MGDLMDLQAALHEPKLPPELERLVVETAAVSHLRGISSLMLVAWRVKDWPFSGVAREQSHREPGFFQHAVRHLFIVAAFQMNGNEIATILRACSGFLGLLKIEDRPPLLADPRFVHIKQDTSYRLDWVRALREDAIIGQLRTSSSPRDRRASLKVDRKIISRTPDPYFGHFGVILAPADGVRCRVGGISGRC